MLFMNFIALVVCIIAAIWQGINGHLGWCLIEIALVLVLIFMIFTIFY